jgi:hypothetical protein
MKGGRIENWSRDAENQGNIFSNSNSNRDAVKTVLLSRQETYEYASNDKEN